MLYMCNIDKEKVVKIELLADVKNLKVGDQVAGPSALTDLRLFGKLGTPLYEVIKSVNRQFAFWKWRYVKIKRTSDQKVLKIDLDRNYGGWVRIESA